MVDIYKAEASEDGSALHIQIPADKIPHVLFIEAQLVVQGIGPLARQIVATHKVRITYFEDDIPALFQHLKEEVYGYTLSQITTIILWCGERMPQDLCLELLKKART